MRVVVLQKHLKLYLCILSILKMKKVAIQLTFKREDSLIADMWFIFLYENKSVRKSEKVQLYYVMHYSGIHFNYNIMVDKI